MKATDTLRGGISQLWQHVTRAGRALTRFTDRDPDRARSGVRVSWGLLPVEISETDETLVVELEVPGLDKRDLSVEVDGRQLVIRGEKRSESSGRRGRYHVLECAYGSFCRVVPLPAPVSDEAASATYARGVLRVELTKQPGTCRRRVTIH